MKKLLSGLLAVAFLLMAGTVMAQDSGKVAVTSTAASTLVDGGVYMLHNDGTASVRWECENTTVSSTNYSTLVSGGTTRVPEGCHRIAYKTLSGTANLRYYATETAAKNSGKGYSVGDGLARDIEDDVCVHLLPSAVTNPTEAGATDDYLSMSDGAGSTTEANEDDYVLFAAEAMSVNNLRCVVDVAPGAGKDSWTMTIRVGTAGALADTDVTCEIDEAAVSCTDTTNDAPVAVGESITVSIDSSGDDADPSAAAAMTCAICLGT
jgi:hypothetical protein